MHYLLNILTDVVEFISKYMSVIGHCYNLNTAVIVVDFLLYVFLLFLYCQYYQNCLCFVAVVGLVHAILCSMCCKGGGILLVVHLIVI